MAVTPEGKIKQEVAEYLISIGCIPASQAAKTPAEAVGWFFNPVPGGYGVAGIHDCLGQYKSRFFSIEVKKPGRRGEKNRGMSAQQKHQYDAINKTRGFAMVFDGGEDDWRQLKRWVGLINLHE